MSENTNYVVKRSEGYSDELKHWGKQESHKYIKKIPMGGGKYRYFYADSEKGASIKRTMNSLDIQKMHNQNRTLTNKNQTKQAEDFARRQNAAISRARRNERIAENQEESAMKNYNAIKSIRAKQRANDRAEVDANRQAESLSKGAAASKAYKSGYNNSKNTKNYKSGYDSGYEAATKAAEKEAKQKRIDDAAAAVVSRQNAALKKAKVVQENHKKKVSTKIKSTVNSTIRKAKKHVDKGRDWLDGLFD